MTAAEAHAAAAAEGLALLRAENPVGFKYVARQINCYEHFQAQLKHGGCYNYLGRFATAEEAALAVARFLGPEGVAAALAGRTASGNRLAVKSTAAPMTAAAAPLARAPPSYRGRPERRS